MGLFTNNPDAHLAFWRDVAGLPYEEALATGRGQVQHRFGVDGSVLKVNHSLEALKADGGSGYRRLYIAQAGRRSIDRLSDPDGNEVELVPPGHLGINQLAVELAVADARLATAFYADTLDFDKPGETVLGCGRSQLRLVHDESRVSTGSLRGPGFRYLTIQIFDLAHEHARILQAGGREGMAPMRMGDTAKFSFVLDPDGNWIEISQRASLTGPLD